MSNLEREPAEVIAECAAETDARARLIRYLPRDVPLGGPRAMNVRRTLPQRGRSTIGAWCFIDHYGPDAVTAMLVPPHPHTGLQTVSWLFEGEIEHRDSTGTHAPVRPGELNLMTAGQGVSHSEVSPAGSRSLHGVQLWIALPDRHRHQAPHFESHRIPPVVLDGVGLRVFAGELAGIRSPAAVYSPLVGAELTLPAGVAVDLPVDTSFEHGVLVDAGTVAVEGSTLARWELGYVEPGRGIIRLANETMQPARVILLGGQPLGEQLVMWWNFVGRSHDEITRWRDEWQSAVIEGTDAAGRFGTVAGFEGPPLPAPQLPTVRLKPRN
ncbi:pirin family protein [Cryobacterium cryoconiti]|uniref:Pirin family protein n=1 Tax=Cryobacterium cryoconiti TaxID=1259239 RepID=A0A4Y8K347_9MICO|nr:pirin family protein [Cryobacterium cryoconiti]TFD33783.1 pirin family protein [Cryobacterium cryoconiti]